MSMDTFIQHYINTMSTKSLGKVNIALGVTEVTMPLRVIQSEPALCCFLNVCFISNIKKYLYMCVCLHACVHL